jgi:hypothetical protein
MFADFNEIDLEKYPNVNVEYLEKTREFPGGRTSFFSGFENYEKVFGLVKKNFDKLEFFEAAPCFFELYKNSKDRGIIVDSKNLEIRIFEEENLDDAFKIHKTLKDNKFNYKIVKDFN